MKCPLPPPPSICIDLSHHRAPIWAAVLALYRSVPRRDPGRLDRPAAMNQNLPYSCDAIMKIGSRLLLWREIGRLDGRRVAAGRGIGRPEVGARGDAARLHLA